MSENSLRSFLTPDSEGTPGGIIVRLLSERGGLTSAQIARLTGLARSTVSTAVAALRHSGVILESEIAEARSVGRPGTLLTLNPEAGTCVGVHLALNELRLAIADVSHSFIAEQNIPLPLDYSPETAAQVLRDWITRAYAENGLRRSGLLGIGVSISAPISPDGIVHRSSIQPTWAGVNLAEVFSEATGTTVLADNESNCSAIAEMLWGAAQGEEDFIFFKLDLGVGGAVVSNARLIRGIAGGTGEFGHISLDTGGELCRCGNRGCVELKAGFRGALQQIAHAYGRPVTIDEVIALARDGDPGAARMIEDAGEAAGRALATIATVLNPPLILIGGALARAGTLVMDPLRDAFEKHTLLKSRSLPPDQRTRFEVGQLITRDVVLGAVGLVLMHQGRIR